MGRSRNTYGSHTFSVFPQSTWSHFKIFSLSFAMIRPVMIYNYRPIFMIIIMIVYISRYHLIIYPVDTIAKGISSTFIPVKSCILFLSSSLTPVVNQHPTPIADPCTSIFPATNPASSRAYHLSISSASRESTIYNGASGSSLTEERRASLSVFQCPLKILQEYLPLFDTLFL